MRFKIFAQKIGIYIAKLLVGFACLAMVASELFPARVTAQNARLKIPAGVAIYALDDSGNMFLYRAEFGRFFGIGKPAGVNGNLIGIDYRPANGALYALSDTGRLYKLTPGLLGFAFFANQVYGLQPRFAGGFQSLMDFNPVVDAIRLIGSNGDNYAIVSAQPGGEPNTAVVQTSLSYAPGDVNAGRFPNVCGGAYTNNYAGAPNTLFYGVDYDLDTFVTIASVSATGSSNTGGGQLQTIGNLVDQHGNPINVSPFADFDIYTDAARNNFLIGVNGAAFHTIDLSQLPANLPLGQTQNIVAQTVSLPEIQTFIDIAVVPLKR
jgi:hypothetical protein